MRLPLLATVICAASLSPDSESRATADNTLTDQEKQDGWILLFDGRTTAGWMTPKGKALPDKHVQDGSLNPHPCDYMLVHEKAWENFRLALDFKISKKCNSGIFVRTFPLTPRPGKDVGFNGIEIAIDDTTAAGFHDTGAIYDLVKPSKNAMKPAGEWNHIVIISDRNLLTVELNGEAVTRMDLDEWTEPKRRPDGTEHKFDVAYKTHPRKGYIGLQDHGRDCWFKNIKLLPLKYEKRNGPSFAEPANSDAGFIASPAELKARIPTQLRATKPDFVVFVPEVTGTNVNDTGNEHFLAFDGPDGSLMAVWTQSSAEAQPDQHIAFARSTDEGVTWSKPRIIAGPKKPGEGRIASWGYPLVSKSGRVYVLYSQHIGKHDNFPHHTGWLHGIHSDDNGRTWSQPQNVSVARSIHDNPDPTMPPNMLCWQKPLRLANNGKYLAGFTRWTSFAVRKNPTASWISADSHVEFMRFENVDENPEVKDLKISWFAANEKALAVPFPGHPEVSACQEPSVVKLPDGRLFCVMRTASGGPFWSVSADLGETWTQPRRLLRKDDGEPLPHPLSPCPIYDVAGNEAGGGRYVLFIHNHDGHYKGYKPTDTGFHRRRIYLVPGRFQSGADQPIWFDEPKFFMDHDGVSLGKPGTKGRLDLALYSSLTVRKGKPVLWYPDRKFFLLGRVIGNEWFGRKGD